MEKMSMSHEDYLEAIVMLGGTTEASVRSVDIATKLGVSKASVNKAVTSLKEKGLADQPYYGDITLTEEGYAYGTSVLDRHHMLFSFLTKALGIPEEQAEREACLMEHAISDSRYVKVYRAVMRAVDERPCTKPEIEDLVDTFDEVKSPRRFGGHFIDMLERTDALEWSEHAWRLTDLGRAMLPAVEAAAAAKKEENHV